MSNDGAEESDDDDDVALDDALEALAEGEAEECLERLEEVDPARGERWTTAVHALVELSEFDAAEAALEQARESLGPDHPDAHWAEGRLRLSQWRLEQAREAFAKLDPEEEGAPLLENLALLADVEGDHAEADELYRRAEELDPENSPSPPRLTPEEFEAIVAEAAAELPDEFRDALEELPVVIDSMPTAALVGAPGSGHPPDVLGLFLGPTRAERNGSFEVPPTIFLFQRNLERAAVTREELREEIRTTLYHELGHALGFDEDGVDELGLA